MHFLKALFWVAVGGFVVLLGYRNWHDVTLNLWGDIQADVKAPVLLGFMFLLGWLPMFLIHRARLWRLRQRLDNYERQQVPTRAATPRPEPFEAE
jgi:lipopolysaccharide assembly protein A